MPTPLDDLIARVRLDTSELQAGVGRSAAIGGAIGAVLGGAINTALSGAMSVVKSTLGAGLDRALNIEDAQAKLTGLGHSAESVSTIMNDALAAVKGTAFGMGDAAAVAASTVAAGVKPGTDLQRTLKLIGDTATITGGSMGELGSVFNKVAASNKVQMDSVNQLQDRGFPILQMLATHLGVTAEEASKMASSGKIDFETFQAAIEGSLGAAGSAAQASGNTVRGALANMQAALGRAGANLFTPLLGSMSSSLGGITSLIDTYVAPIGTKIGEGLAAAIPRAQAGLAGLRAIFTGGGYTVDLRTAFGLEEDSGVVDFLLSLRDTISEVMQDVRDSLGGIDLGGIFDTLGASLSGVLPGIVAGFAPIGEAVLGLVPALSQLVPSILQVVSAFNPVSLIVQSIVPVLPQLSAAFGTMVGGILTAITPLIPVLTQIATMVAGQLGQAFATIAPILAQVATTFGGVLAQAITSIAPIIAQVGQVVASILPSLVTLAGTVLTALADAFTSILPALLPLVDVLGGVLLTIVQALAPIITQLAGILAQLLPPIIGLVAPIVELVATALTPLITIFGDLIGAILPPLLDLLMAVITPVAQLAGTLASALAPVLDLVAGIISGALAPILSTLIGWLSNVITWVLKLAGPVLGGLTNVLSTVIGWIANVIGSIASWLSSIGGVSGAIDAMKNAVSNGVSNVVTFFRELPGKILSAIGDLGAKMLNVGKDIVQGMIDGVSSMANKAVEKVKNLGSDLMGGIKGILGIASPSKEFRKIGAWTAEGLALGIEGQTRAVASAARGMADAVNVPMPDLGVGYGVNGAARGAGNGYGAGGGGAPVAVGVRVYLGDREVTDIVRTEVFDMLDAEASAIVTGVTNA